MKKNNISELNNISRFQRSEQTKNFYSPYVGDIKEKRSNEELTIYEADSPNGPGKMHISVEGGYYDECTGEMGSMADFSKKRYPLLTDLGAITAVRREYTDYLKFDIEKSDKIFDQNALYLVRDLAWEHKRVMNEGIDGLITDILENGDLIYTEVNEIQHKEHPGSGMCHYTSYLVDSYFAPVFFRFIYGVQKIEEHPNAKCIYFVEDPLQLAMLTENVDDPVYIRPDQESFFHNDYNRLVKGKEVLLAKKVIPGPFELDKLEYLKFNSDEDVDFFTYYGEETPQEQDWEENELHRFLRSELITQKSIMVDYLQKRGIEAIPFIK